MEIPDLYATINGEDVSVVVMLLCCVDIYHIVRELN